MESTTKSYRLSKEFKAGLIVILGTLAVVLGFSYLKSNSLLGKSTKLYAVYDHIGGLQSGTTVTLNGFSIGTIDEISFLDNSGKLLVTYTLITDIDIPKNSIAELYDASVLGGKALQVVLGDPSTGSVVSGDTLRSTVRLGMADKITELLEPLEQKVSSAINETDLLIKSLNQVLDTDGKAQLSQTLTNFTTISESVKAITTDLNKALTANEDGLQKVVGNTVSFTDDLAQLTKELKDSGLSDLVTNLNRISTSLNQVTTQLAAGEGTLGELLQNPSIYLALEANMKELELLMQDLRLNPKRYLSVSVFGKKQQPYELPENDPAKSKN